MNDGTTMNFSVQLWFGYYPATINNHSFTEFTFFNSAKRFTFG